MGDGDMRFSLLYKAFARIFSKFGKVLKADGFGLIWRRFSMRETRLSRAGWVRRY